MTGEHPGNRAAWALLALAVTAASALALALTRGTTLGADEYWFFVVNRGLDLRYLLSPHAGNLIFVVRLLYAAVFGLVGPDYVVLRVVEVVLVGLAAWLLAALLRRRIPPLPAALLAVPLLFMGAAGEVVLAPLGINIVLAIDLGLAALLALERRTRRGDVAAGALLTLSVLTFSAGLAFVVAAAVAIALTPGWPRRLAVVAVPAALYVAWKLFAPIDTGPGYLVAAPVAPGHLLHLPLFALHAAAAAAAGVSGLYLPFGRPAVSGAGTLEHPGIGVALVALLVLALLARAARGELRRSLWTPVALGVAFWSSVLLALSPDRFANSTRYLVIGAIVVLLLTSEALRPVRWRPAALAALAALVAVAVGLGVVELGDYASGLRTVARFERAGEAAMEVGRRAVRVNVVPGRFSGFAAVVDIGGGVGPYLAAVRRWGSPAFSLAELRREPEGVRAFADEVTAAVEGLRLLPGVDTRVFSAGHGCRRLTAGAARVPVRAPGVVVRSPAGGTVSLGRFAARATARVGVLAPGATDRLAVPADGAPDPWWLALPGEGAVICPL